METFFFKVQLFSHHMFKSYYVVWKPEDIASSDRVVPMFKSYYVVWKL